jgi:hypothetical protein
MTCDKKIIERPQHMIMRVALGKECLFTRPNYHFACHFESE